MIIVLKQNSVEADKLALVKYLTEHHIAYHLVPQQHIVVITKQSNIENLPEFPCIESTHQINTPYKLASKIWKESTIFSIGSNRIGDGIFNIMAGPCSVENEDQIFSTAEFLSKLGVKFLRGGAYKPRTSPYSFRGLGKTGLQLLRKAADKYNMGVVTEILDYSLLDEVMEYTDVLQVGSRNMHNFYLLDQLGKINKPVLLKRGFQGKTVEWLLAAEYILSGGNEQVILCERGIRSFDPSSRNILDLGIVPLIKELSHLPIIVDPSHGTGTALRVKPASLAAAAIGADGILVEVHPNPAKALSDSEQALTFEEFEKLLTETQNLLKALGKQADTESIPLKTESL